MHQFDTVIVGGGPAGLSAALALGRSRRDVLVLDSGDYRNAPTHHSHNFLTQDGTPPAEMRRIAHRQLDRYPGLRIAPDRAVSAAGTAGDFMVRLTSGETVATRTIILATGVRDELPPVRGIEAIWGTTAVHCPYCDGWENRDRPMAFLGQGDRAETMATHMGPLLRNLTADLIMLTDGPSRLTPDARNRLAGLGVALDERPIDHLASHNGQLNAVVFGDGDHLGREVLFISPTMRPNAGLAGELGCELVADGPVVGQVRVDGLGQTTVPGVWAAGDLSAMAPAVSMAVASGTMAGAAVNLTLTALAPLRETAVAVRR